MTVKVKICGLTRADDVRCVIDNGADYAGFVRFEKSPRHVSLQQLEALGKLVPPTLRKVGVFVNPTPGELRDAVLAGGLQVVQFHHPDALPAVLELQRDPQFSQLEIWQVFALRSPQDVETADSCPFPTILVDSMREGQWGGTGKQGNWQLAAQLARQRQMMLAGGLKPENVGEAVRTVQPYGVDVSSGVEAEPGRKDHRMVKNFITEANSRQA